MKKAALLGIVLSVLVVEAGCMMGPKYKRPTVSVPTGYRSAMPDQPAAAASLGNEKWWDVYQDPVLADLIHTALQQNYDVQIPAADRSRSGPDARKRVGAAGGDFVPRCKRGDGLFPASGARQPTRNLEAHTGLAATVPETNRVP